MFDALLYTVRLAKLDFALGADDAQKHKSSKGVWLFESFFNRIRF
jgi:hypothetical protein